MRKCWKAFRWLRMMDYTANHRVWCLSRVVLFLFSSLFRWENGMRLAGLNLNRQRGRCSSQNCLGVHRFNLTYILAPWQECTTLKLIVIDRRYCANSLVRCFPKCFLRQRHLPAPHILEIWSRRWIEHDQNNIKKQDWVNPLYVRIRCKGQNVEKSISDYRQYSK